MSSSSSPPPTKKPRRWLRVPCFRSLAGVRSLVSHPLYVPLDLESRSMRNCHESIPPRLVGRRFIVRVLMSTLRCPILRLLRLPAYRVRRSEGAADGGSSSRLRQSWRWRERLVQPQAAAARHAPSAATKEVGESTQYLGLRILRGSSSLDEDFCEQAEMTWHLQSSLLASLCSAQLQFRGPAHQPAIGAVLGESLSPSVKLEKSCTAHLTLATC